MKKLTIITYLLLHFCIANGQIVTPGFTHYTICPDNYSEVDRCIGWRQPTGGTSDYFNACASGTNVGVPQNIFGYQTALDGAYAGLYTYINDSFLSDYREYIGTSIAPLIVGHTYTMTITVSLADSSHYATDGLGVFFSTYMVDYPGSMGVLSLTPQVDYSNYGIITDKVNWITLSKTFVADSAYTNLAVGCFKPDGSIHKDTLNQGQIETKFASYYYIGRIGLPDGIEPSIDTTRYIFPSGFTPNGDGTNDVFRIAANPGTVFQKYSFSVYNRFGQRVFFTEDPASGWNGIFNNVPQDIGVYFYMASFTANGNEQLLKGDVTLIR